MEQIVVKSILYKVKPVPFWFDNDYNMNLYRGCSHGCIYCDSRSECYQITDFEKIVCKANALNILEKELVKKRKKGIIAMGSMSDPYNPYEKQEQLTSGALHLIAKYHFGTLIITKSPLIIRDISLLKEIKKHHDVCIALTITTANDELCKMIEPGVDSTSKRFEALQKLSEQGIFCGVLLMPLLPFVNDTEENIVEIIKLAKANGARFIYPFFGVTLRQGNREYLYQALDRLFPGIKEKYIRMYQNQYDCRSLQATALGNAFKKECEKANILYDMPTINRAMRQYQSPKQLSLFDNE